MAKRQIFYSFHFNNDVMRVQQIRNMGVIEGNTPVSVSAWEEAKKTPGGIEKWIYENMQYKSCVVVLIGEETANRPWVKYEIEKAWNDGKGVFGIYIHNISCPRNGKCVKGNNPFEQFTFENGNKLSSVARCYDPSSNNAYNDIKNNIESWIEAAIKSRN